MTNYYIILQVSSNQSRYLKLPLFQSPNMQSNLQQKSPLQKETTGTGVPPAPKNDANIKRNIFTRNVTLTNKYPQPNPINTITLPQSKLPQPNSNSVLTSDPSFKPIQNQANNSMNTSVQPSFQNNSLNAGQKNTSNLPFHQNNTNNQSTGNFASNFSNTKPLETLGNLKGPSNNAGFQADPTVKIGNAPMTGTTNNIFNRNPNQTQPKPSPFIENSFSINPQIQKKQNTSRMPSMPANELQLLQKLYSLQISETNNIGQLTQLANPYNLYNTKKILFYLLNQFDKDINEQKKASRSNQYISALITKSDSLGQIIFITSQILKAKKALRDVKAKNIGYKQQINKIIQKFCKNKESKNNSNLKNITKIAGQIRQEYDLYENQLINSIKPLYLAYEYGNKIRFDDPNTFTIQVARKLQNKVKFISKNIQNLANQLAEVLSQAKDKEDKNSVQAKQICNQLIQHFENTAMHFQNLKDRYLEERGMEENEYIQRLARRNKTSQNCKITELLNNLKALMEQRTCNLAQNQDQL